MKLYEDKKWLYQKYVVERLSMEKVARLCNPQTTAATILRWLGRHGIETRNLSEAGLGSEHQAKRHKGLFRNKEWMIQKYIKEDLSGRQIAAICGVARHTIINHLKKHDINIRPSGSRKGEKNVLWKGGSKAYGERRRKTKEYKEYRKKWLKAHPDHMTERCRKMKRRAIEYKGGGCLICSIKFDGNNACIFDFHHREPNEKDITIGALISRKWEKVKEELDKTDMLCSNCHRLRHYNNGGNDVCASR